MYNKSFADNAREKYCQKIKQIIEIRKYKFKKFKAIEIRKTYLKWFFLYGRILNTNWRVFWSAFIYVICPHTWMNLCGICNMTQYDI